MDVSGRAHFGVLTGQDMATWAPTVETPLHLDYGSYRVFKPGPWTQGPVLLQILALMKGFDVDKLSVTSPEFVHLWVEAAKLAYADREAFYGDPKFVEVPMDVLLSEAYNAERRKLIGDTASLEQRPGSIAGFGGQVIVKGAREVGAGAGEPTFAKIEAHAERTREDGRVVGDTVHIDIIDKAGNVFTATPSGGWLQSSPVIPSLGWPLGTRGQMFWLEEGQPASLAPGKRPRSTLSVGMALRDGKPYMSWGTPGGDQLDQWSCHPAHEPAGGDRRASVAHRAFPGLVLAAQRATRRAGGRGTPARRDHGRVAAARPQGRGRAGLVGGPPDGRCAGRRASTRGRQSARHARLCGRTLIGHDRAAHARRDLRPVHRSRVGQTAGTFCVF
jgi:hypothetical protein